MNLLSYYQPLSMRVPTNREKEKRQALFWIRMAMLPKQEAVRMCFEASKLLADDEHLSTDWLFQLKRSLKQAQSSLISWWLRWLIDLPLVILVSLFIFGLNPWLMIGLFGWWKLAMMSLSYLHRWRILGIIMLAILFFGLRYLTGGTG